jgi:hypothetical protein
VKPVQKEATFANPLPQKAAPVQNPAPIPKSTPTIKCGSHLKKTTDITGFPEFPAGTKSLLSKFLTKDVFAEYHGKKDKAGVSFE